MIRSFCLKMANKFFAVMGLFLGMNLLGAVLFEVFETQNVSFIRALYWSFITSLSVGYGDVSPETNAGMILAVMLAWIVLLFIVPLVVTVFAGRVIKSEHEYSDSEQKRVEAKIDALLIAAGIDPKEFE